MKAGDTAKFKRKITKLDVAKFASLSGDKNPLHLSKSYASKTIFKKPIVHGMFLGALCSRLVGMYLPGKRCLYLSQDLSFKQPVFVGDTVEVNGRVESFSSSVRLGEVRIEISVKGKLCAVGLAKVKIL